MNKKDLFNAINDIDEKFITDAGKYLTHSHGKSDKRSFRNAAAKKDVNKKSDDTFQYGEPIKVRPSERKFSPIKILTSAAAAAVLIVGITVALKVWQSGIFVGNTAGTSRSYDNHTEISEDSVDTAPSAIGGGSSENSANTKNDPNRVQTTPEATPVLDENGEPTGNLPFTLYGPDNQQITYEEISEIYESVSKQYLNDSNWVRLHCNGFAYISDSHGENYNNIDDPEKFDGSEIAWEVATRNFRRIYEGDQYGDLTVRSAYSIFWRTPTNGMTEQQMRENNLPLSLLFEGSYVEFDGEVTVDAYIVKTDNSPYLCVLRNGEAQIPTMNINVQDDGSFGSYLYCASESGFEFKSELPSIVLESTAEENKFFTEKNYQKARVTLSNITINYDAASQVPYYVTANAAVMDIQFDDSDIEPSDVSSLIRRSLTVEDLKAKVMEKYDTLYDVRAYYDVYDIVDRDIIVGDEVSEGELQSGMTVGLYDQNGLVGIYTYQQK